MTDNEIIKECRELAKKQNIAFKRSKTINKINGKACYEIHSKLLHKTLHQGCLHTIWETLLSEALKDK